MLLSKTADIYLDKILIKYWPPSKRLPIKSTGDQAGVQITGAEKQKNDNIPLLLCDSVPT
jgi:hypothetical protein